MAGNILSPVTIWGDFKIESSLHAEVVNWREEDGIIVQRIYVDGRSTKKGTVKIYGILARPKDKEKMPAVLLMQNFTSALDEKLTIDFAKRGYMAFMVDFCGSTKRQNKFTIYPPDIEYANFEKSKSELSKIESDVKKTCWYEWGCVGKYALAYLKSLEAVTKTGALGIRRAASVLWQVAATEKDLSCAVFVLNTGWRAYRGRNKYGVQTEESFSDDLYKYLAGVEPQSYAQYVKTPSLVLSSTNSLYYDADRAFDTVSRINDSVYKALDFSVSYGDGVDGYAYRDMHLFFDEFLLNEKNNLPESPEITCEIKEKRIKVSVKAEEKGLKKIEVFVAEEVVTPSLRAWSMCGQSLSVKDGSFTTEYSPNSHSKIAFFFAKAEYENGFTVSSGIIAKRFNEKDVLEASPSNIIYTSRNQNAEKVFTVVPFAKDELRSYMNDLYLNDVLVKTGPMDIDGVYSPRGLMTYKINATKDKPKSDSILLFDIYSKEDNLITVKMIADLNGEATEYVSTFSVNGGEVWHNIKMDISKFKTTEGRLLKGFENVNAIQFIAEKFSLLNNVLWV